MELGTLTLTLAIILPFFIQFHFLLDDPWKLCTAFHYYSSISKPQIPKSKPKLILHYPKIPNCNFKSSSISNTPVEKISSLEVTNLETEPSSPLIIKARTEVIAQKISQNSEMFHFSRDDSPDSKNVSKKSGLTNFVQKERGNSLNNTELEYLYSRDLFFFEYRKKPELKSEGTQFGSQEKQNFNSRNLRRNRR